MTKSVSTVLQFLLPHTRGSSHGQTRIIRKAYEQDFYLPMMHQAYELWAQLEKETGVKLYRWAPTPPPKEAWPSGDAGERTRHAGRRGSRAVASANWVKFRLRQLLLAADRRVAMLTASRWKHRQPAVQFRRQRPESACARL